MDMAKKRAKVATILQDCTVKMTKAAAQARNTVAKAAPKGSAKAVAKPVVVEEPEVESSDEEEDEDDFDGSEVDEEEEGDEDDEDDDEEEGDEDDDEEDEEDDEDEEEGDEEDSEDEEGNENSEDVVDDLEYDVYNLLASNYHAVRILAGENKEQVLQDNAQRAAQLLMKKIFACPTEPSDVGPLVLLPNEIQLMPRATKVPEPKPETKWEKFAKEKGIKKHKRERMVFDESNQEFRPRFGYKGANSGIEEIPIVEVKPGQDPFADPWAEARTDKKARVKKNTKQMLKNQGRALGKKGYDPEKIPGIPTDLGTAKGKRGRGGLKTALQLVQHSTASMGRYDEMRPGEPLRKLSGKKRSFRDNIGGAAADKDSMKAQLRFVADKADKKSRGVTNSLAAYEGIVPDAPSDSFKQRKGRGKAPKTDGKKGKGGGKGRK